MTGAEAPVGESVDFDSIVYDECRKHLDVFISLVHQTDEGDQAIPPPHLRRVIEAIEDDTLGHTVIILPPGGAKTNTMIGAMSWWLGQDPTQHTAYICNNVDRAVERSLAIKDVITSPLYQEIFPYTQPNKDRGWSAVEWYLRRPNINDKNPSALFAGVGSSILGARIHRAVLDDIADEENMKTDLQRSGLHRWLGETFMTRLHPRKGRAIMICTRWHEDDPAQWAIDRGWHVVHIPALDESGASYWEDYYPASWLSCPNDQHTEGAQCCQKKQLGASAFAKQYLGILVNEESALFKTVNWRSYNETDLKPNLEGGIFVDLAHTEDKQSDYTVIAAIAKDGPRRYWRDVVRRRMEFPEAKREVREMRQKFPNYAIVIEDQANSKPMIQELKLTEHGVIAWPLGGRSKRARAQASLSSHEAGDWFLPKKPWADIVISEHTGFDSMKHDDTVDISTMQHAYWNRSHGMKFIRTRSGRRVLSRA